MGGGGGGLVGFKGVMPKNMAAKGGPGKNILGVFFQVLQ